MAPQVQKSEFTLQLSRTFQASREVLFRAWTDPEALKKWGGPEWCACPEAEGNLTSGGQYRLTICDSGEEEYQLSGTFLEVSKPEKLVYSWNCDHPRWAPIGETIVTVEFQDLGDSTKVVVSHEIFPDAQAQTDHEKGWSSALDCLSSYLISVHT